MTWLGLTVCYEVVMMRVNNLKEILNFCDLYYQDEQEWITGLDSTINHKHVPILQCNSIN